MYLHVAIIKTYPLLAPFVSPIKGLIQAYSMEEQDGICVEIIDSMNNADEE